MITEEQLHDLGHLLNLSCEPCAMQIRFENDVYRLDCGDDVFFLKTYTKPWYGSDIARTSFNANHEACAWTILAQYRLPAPDVAYVATDCDNPLARPFVVTRQLQGTPFTTLLLSAPDDQRNALLFAVGAYL